MKSNGLFENLDINLIELDRDNPRIALAKDTYGYLNEVQISMALDSPSDRSDKGTTTSELEDSIKSTGGISQPIIVNKTNGRYIVIEGNTRLMLYKKFIETGVSGDWTTIPAIVYENMSEEQKHEIRLQAHIVGPRAWDAYSKAKYLKKLRDEECLTLGRIVDLCGGKKSDINDFIEAYDDMEKYYHSKVEPKDFDVKQYSVFKELVSGKKRVFALSSNGFTKEDFGKWVIEGKIGNAQNVRRLAEVLNDRELRELFLRTDLPTAIAQIPQSNIIINASLKELVESLNNKICSLPFDVIKALKQGEYRDELDSIENLMSTLESFVESVK